MSSIEKTIKLVESALKSLDGELSNSPDPKLANVPRVQKEAFKQKLQKIISILALGSLPEKCQRNFGLSRAIADNWHFDSKLGKEIAKAERSFIEVK